VPAPSSQWRLTGPTLATCHLREGAPHGRVAVIAAIRVNDIESRPRCSIVELGCYLEAVPSQLLLNGRHRPRARVGRAPKMRREGRRQGWSDVTSLRGGDLGSRLASVNCPGIRMHLCTVSYTSKDASEETDRRVHIYRVAKLDITVGLIKKISRVLPLARSFDNI
jgi:hypothetical protein